MLSLIISCLSWNQSFAQYKKGFKLLDKKDYAAAVTAFEADLEDPKNAIPAKYGLAKIYSEKRYEGLDIKKAYTYIVEASAEYKKLPSKDRLKLQNQGYSSGILRSLHKSIVGKAAKEATETNTTAVYNDFIDTYPTASRVQIKNMHLARNRSALADAKKEDTHTAYLTYHDMCHKSCVKYEQNDVRIEGEKLFFESYIREKSWNNYARFSIKYPNNIYVQDSVGAMAFLKIAKRGTLQQFKDFAQRYQNENSPFVKIAIDSLYAKIIESALIEEYDYFIRNHSSYPKAEVIWKKFYKVYIEKKGKASVEEFNITYPNFPFREQLSKDLNEYRKQKEKPDFEKTKNSEDSGMFLDFLKKYPNSPYIKDLEQPMFKALKKDAPHSLCTKFVRLFPKSKHLQPVLEMVLDHYVMDGELSSLKLFQKRYPQYRNQERMFKEQVIAKKGFELHLERPFQNKYRNRYEEYIKEAAPKALAFVALQRYIEDDIKMQRWDNALGKIDRFKGNFGTNHKELNNLIALLKDPDENVRVAKVSYPREMNTTFTNEYVPVLSADERYMYFCRWDVKRLTEEVFVAEYVDGAWQKAEPMEDVNTPQYNEGPLSVSADNNYLILFIQGNLFYTEREAEGWSEPKSMDPNIASPYWDADAVISSDGNALLFSSKRKEILGIHREKWNGPYHGDAYGDIDLFVSLKQSNGRWGKPINLGETLNTRFAERTPFLHYDMKTLYFSSDGHGGLGKMDVYKTERLDDSWTNWSKPINLGKQINTVDNDWGYKISTDGKRAYFAAAEVGANGTPNLDLFWLNLPENMQADNVCTVTGNLKDNQGNSLGADILCEDLTTGKVVANLKSDPQTGNFFITLPEGKQYSYYVSKEGYFPVADHIDLTEQACPINIQADLELPSIEAMVEEEIALPLKNLFFDFNKFNIKSNSFPELDRLAELVKQYDLLVEISGHTDHVGSNKDNLVLSRNRASAVRDYLLRQKCDKDNIKSVGYGEGQPIATNDTDEGRALNRRVEVRFKWNNPR
ncbi:MAG: OmpA family protein [Saprospiraceae bacterium]|nr:OmpA family protein [Saprospiraceae bacterium]